MPPDASVSGGSVSAAVGSFSYRANPDGTVTPDPAWVARKIRTEQMPIIGSVTGNVVMLPQLRGALNALLTGERPKQVVTASGGNHGIGVATAAAILGLPATVFVPDGVPPSKARRIEAAGARLVRAGTRYSDAAAAAREAAQAPGARYVEAYNDPVVVAGHPLDHGQVTAG